MSKEQDRLLEELKDFLWKSLNEGWITEGQLKHIVALTREATCKEIFDGLEKEFGYFTDDELAKIIVDDYGYYGNPGSLKKYQAFKSKFQGKLPQQGEKG